MLLSLVAGLVADDRHVPALYAVWQKRKQFKIDQKGMGIDMVFPTGATVRNIEEAWKIDFVAGNSDMPIPDLSACKGYDDDAITNFITFMCGVPPNMKFNEHMLVRSVAAKVLEERKKLLSGRLDHFKRNVFFQDGKVDWSRGCYSPTYDSNNLLVKLKHISGVEVKADGMNINKDFVLQDNFSDFGATFLKKPMPGIKCHLVFKDSANGPYTAAHITSSTKAFTDLCKAEYDKWKTQRDQNAAGSGSSVIAQRAVTSIDQNKRRASAAGARDKAKAALAKKRAKHQVKIQ